MISISRRPLSVASFADMGLFAAFCVGSMLLDRGYFDAELLRSEVRVDPVNNSASVTLRYASGARYRFGTVTFQQADGLELPLLQRYVPFKQGEPYDSNKILKLQTALGDSEYFQQVDVEPRRDQAQDLAVPVEQEPPGVQAPIGAGLACPAVILVIGLLIFLRQRRKARRA